MTIAERKAREAYDREHPWLPIAKASREPEGTVCELRHSVADGGVDDFGSARFFLHNNGQWYRIDPAGKQWSSHLVEYRPTGELIGKGRRDLVLMRADNGYVGDDDKGDPIYLEYRGGRTVARPAPYKLYWRSGE